MSAYLSGAEFGMPASCMVHRLANIAGVIEAGENCRIDAFVTITGRVKMGRNCHIGNGAAIFATHGVDVGDDTSISPAAQIFTTSFDKDTRYLANPMIDGKLYVSDPVVIGSRCIVGAGSVVLPGSVIDDDTCIGALSLVRSVENGKKFNTLKTPLTAGLWAGIPARRIA